jgi:hypothetical protein
LLTVYFLRFGGRDGAPGEIRTPDKLIEGRLFVVVGIGVFKLVHHDIVQVLSRWGRCGECGQSGRIFFIGSVGADYKPKVLELL